MHSYAEKIVIKMGKDNTDSGAMVVFLTPEQKVAFFFRKTLQGYEELFWDSAMLLVSRTQTMVVHLTADKEKKEEAETH